MFTFYRNAAGKFNYACNFQLTHEKRNKSDKLTRKCSCIEIELEFEVLVDDKGGRAVCATKIRQSMARTNNKRIAKTAKCVCLPSFSSPNPTTLYYQRQIGHDAHGSHNKDCVQSLSSNSCHERVTILALCRQNMCSSSKSCQRQNGKGDDKKKYRHRQRVARKMKIKFENRHVYS